MQRGVYFIQRVVVQKLKVCLCSISVYKCQRSGSFCLHTLVTFFYIFSEYVSKDALKIFITCLIVERIDVEERKLLSSHSISFHKVLEERELLSPHSIFFCFYIISEYVSKDALNILMTCLIVERIDVEERELLSSQHSISVHKVLEERELLSPHSNIFSLFILNIKRCS